MHGGVWQVKKEWLFAVGLDEFYRLSGVLRGDGGIALYAILNYLKIAHQGQRYLLAVHVVAVGDAKVMIEALAGGHEIGVIAQVPFADAHGCVAFFFEHLGHGDLAGVEALAGGGKKHAQVFFIHVHIHAARITAGHEAGTRRRADWAGGIEVG